MAQPIPHPDTPADAIKSRVLDARNRAAWLKDEKMSRWLDACRLDIVAYFLPKIESAEEYRARDAQRIKTELEEADAQEKLLLAEGHKLYD
jgi:hypothetical protein